VSSASVGIDFFDALRAPIMPGRAFHSGDLAAGQRSVIVNETFVRLVMGGRNPIGRRLRFVHYEEWREPRPFDANRSPWHEIVGVVRDLDVKGSHDPKIARVYHPTTPQDARPLKLVIHVKGDPASFLPRLREVAAAVDPDLRLQEAAVIGAAEDSDVPWLEMGFRLVVMVSLIALALSLAGIYAVMSFTVSRRTREIGIRVALGANRTRLLAAVFARPFTHIVLGIVAGIAVVAGMRMLQGFVVVAAYALVMLAVCLLACVIPTRRALRIDPMDSLRVEG
jgi:hypothetical protein